MAPFSLCFISFLLLLLLLSPLSTAADNDSTSSICESTHDPTYCKSVLPTSNTTADIYFYGKYSERRSLSHARKFVALVDKSLANRATLTTAASRALEDCRFLAATNLDFIFTSFRTVNGTSNILSEKNADDVHTLLSAVLTNLDTCFGGLWVAAASENELSSQLKNDTKLHSLSLALFVKGWVPEKKKKRVGGWNPRRFTFSRGGVSVSMSRKARQVYEKATVRTLLQEGVDSVMVNDIVVVSQDGTGNFTTINDAVSAAPNNTDGSDGYFMIYVTSGIYQEYVSIDKNKKYLMMVGDGINQTIITGNRSVADNFTTFNSATFAVVAPNFVSVNITFQNTAGAVKHQAVAVRNGADLSTFYSCSFEGYQDTLYMHSMRQFYRECDIYGTVDFIFGNGVAVLQTCNLYPRLPMSGQFNAITAQGRTDPNQNTGTSIHNCTITAAPDLASSNATVKTYLGRPWKEYSRTVYMQSFMDSLINPIGWREWNETFAFDTLYYAEFNNTGPGSNTPARVTWPGYHVINATDALNFTVSNFLLGDMWLPQTKTPYMGGLI